MKKHIKVYHHAIGAIPGEPLYSELSGCMATDIHHIFAGGMGGGKRKEDRIENLMALTRDEHDKYGDRKDTYLMLLIKHRKFLDSWGIKYDKKWFDEKIKMYEYEED